jgi:Arc/MetJ-type ribon-helix-helix transcriptional regulator
MTIHLPSDIESSIQAAVHSGHFVSVDDAMTEAASLLLQRLRQEQPQPKPPSTSQLEAAPISKPIWEKFEDIAAGIPQEVWDKIPADSSEQLDHYLYGSPRRPAR